jgi:hypothetical protein
MKLSLFIILSGLAVLSGCGDQRSRQPITSKAQEKSTATTKAVNNENCTPDKAVKRTYKYFKNYLSSSHMKDREIKSIDTNNTNETFSYGITMETVLMVEFDTEKRIYIVSVDMGTCNLNSIRGSELNSVTIDGQEVH